MDVEDVKQKKQELDGMIAELLNKFEDETGVEISDVESALRLYFDKTGRVVSRKYVVDVKVNL